MKSLFLSTWFALAITGVTTAAAQPPGSEVVLGYYPSWADNLPPDKINFRLFTHLVHAFATIKDGAIHTDGNLPSRELTRDAHAAGVHVLLGLGGEGSGAGFSAMTQSPALEQACVASLVKLVTDNGYDGVDVDWEFPAASDKANVVSFVSTLRDALRQANPRALVTMPLPDDDYNGQYFDGPRLAPLVDFIQIMSYDVHGPWKDDNGMLSHAGFNSPLNETDTDKIDGHDASFRKAVDYWRGKGFSDRQLVIGIPLYGHGFAVKQWGQTPRKDAVHPDIDYRAIPALIDAGWQRQWDDQAAVPWLRSPAGVPKELISYDDAQSIALKGRWARVAGIRGIFFWEISEDYIGGHNVLVEAARKGFEPVKP